MSTRAWTAFAAVSTLWGIPYLFIKVAVDDGVPPVFLAWGRVSMAAVVLLLSIVVLGLFCTAAAFVLFGQLIGEVGPGRATVITYISPIVAVALGVAVLGEHPGAGAVAGLLLILAGSWLSTDGRLPPGVMRRASRLRGRLNSLFPDRQPDVAEPPSPRSTTMKPLRPLLATVLAGAALMLAACGSDGDNSSSTPAAASTTASTTATAADSCQKASLDLVNAGQLTVATDKPAYPPYFADDKPSNGKGFESAVAYAIAKQLGFTPDEVKWTVEPFNSSYAPGPKKFDFDVNQISISPARAKRVDFSTPYYTAPQAVVALSKSGAAKATSLADLKTTKLGVQIGTTSLDATTQTIKPSAQPQVFNDSNDVVRALKTGRVDAVVVDLPTAFYLTAAQVENSKIVGQFQAPGGDTWGALLQKGSKLTPCVSGAVDKLSTSGELKALETKWMGAAAGAPELR